MQIIPDNLAPDQQDLAGRLVADTTDPAIAAATGLLLHMPDAPILRPDLAGNYIHDDGDDAGIYWGTLRDDLDRGRVPVSADEADLMQAAYDLAGWHMTSMDVGHRRLLVEAVAHACGVDLADLCPISLHLADAAATVREDPETGEPVPAGVDGHPAGKRQPTAGPNESQGLTAGYVDAVIQALRAAGLTVADHETVVGHAVDISLAHRWYGDGLSWPTVTLGWRFFGGRGWYLLPRDPDTGETGPVEALGLSVAARPAEVAAMVAELLADDPAEQPSKPSPDQAGRAAAMANMLHRLADTIAVSGVAPPMYRLSVTAVLATIADLETWATMLGVPITAGGVDGSIPRASAPEWAQAGGLLLTVSAQAQESLPDGSRS